MIGSEFWGFEEAVGGSTTEGQRLGCWCLRRGPLERRLFGASSEISIGPVQYGAPRCCGTQGESGRFQVEVGVQRWRASQGA